MKLKKIVLFAGTTEGRLLSECLSEAQIAHTICVATEYGEIVLQEHAQAEIHRGRMDREQMRVFFQEQGFEAVVDATHPYAELVTENIKKAAQELGISYLRLARKLEKVHGTDVAQEENNGQAYDGVVMFEENEACARALQQVEGNILLTTGSKELSAYCKDESVKNRLYVRVLPGVESIRLCEEQGICGKQILALQGPFTGEMNEAMLRQYRIKCLVTKMSGSAGGFQEKVEAARRVGIPVYVIGRRKEEKGDSFAEVCEKLMSICGKEIPLPQTYEIVLAGIGMGSKNNLTDEVSTAIEDADFLLGAERMIEKYHPRLEKKPYYLASQIIPYLLTCQEQYPTMKGRKVVVLFSGDTGFYSGCQSLYQELTKAIALGGLRANVKILPGISAVSYLAACAGIGYQDAAICSMHGKELPNLARRLRSERKTFLLMSGVQDVNRLGRELMSSGLEHCRVVVGYQMSYPNQKVMTLTPGECCKLQEDGLYSCLVLNDQAEGRCLTPAKTDAEFLRGNVPMTKEEVRHVSICKLRLRKGAVVYDIGSGTGSIAVEIAGLSDDIRVIAVEYKDEAIDLIGQNGEKFGLDNIAILPAKAPEGLETLPVATHAFIGGSGGQLREILSVLYRINPHMRVVINAISLETICELRDILQSFPVCGEDLISMQVNRSKTAGNYHLMQSENPVWIMAFTFQEGVENET